MAKIFTHRVYSPSKVVQTVAEPLPVLPPPPDLAELRAEAERAKRARAEARAEARAAVKPTGPSPSQVHQINSYTFSFHNADMIMVDAMMKYLARNKDANRHRHRAILMPWLNATAATCCVCEKNLTAADSMPAIIIRARPKPPSKKQPMPPVCVCDTCFMDKDSDFLVHASFLLYAKIIDPSIDMDTEGVEQEIIDRIMRNMLCTE
jgi:hypothetical protein